MPQRNITLITKQSNQPSSALPTSPLIGEALVNTADGKVFYKGFISGTGATTYLPSLSDAAYFEVGAHVSELKIGSRIVGYGGQSGAGLAGRFLSGTSTGFVLANISAIQGIDTFVTGATANNSSKVYSFTNNFGNTFNVAGLIDLTITGASFNTSSRVITLTNNTGGTFSSNAITDTFVTGGTYNATTGIASYVNTTGGTFTVSGFNSSSGASDTFVTGATANNSSKVYTFTNNTGGTFTVSGLTDMTVVSSAYNAGTGILTFTNTTGGTFTANGIFDTDRYTTGATFVNNNLLLTDNSGGTVNVVVNTFTGITVNGSQTITGGLGISGATNVGGNLIAANISTSSAGAATIGTGGLTIGSGGFAGTTGTGNLVVHGNITVFGESFSAFTSNLYVEDNNITLNYNPTGDTFSTSLGAGLSVQDGLGFNGATGDTVNFQIAQTGAPVSVADAYNKRFWETNLTAMMLGSTGATGTGQFVLLSQDVLNGGTY